MLPFDYARCQPEIASDKCQSCARYADHQDQTWGPRTAFVLCEGEHDPHCHYLPADREDNK